MPKPIKDIGLACLPSSPRGLVWTAETASAMGETRKLAAILVADVVGYSRLAGPTRTERSRAFGRSEAT